MSANQDNFIISIMSRDRVGIVYEVSKAISDLEGDIADIRQSVVCGYFTMILLASFPAKIALRDIERKLAELDAGSETTINAVVKKVEENTTITTEPYPDNVYVLTATGADQVGFVATVSSFCVRHNINILDLSTTVSDGVYIMILMIDLRHAVSIKEVRRDLETFSKETGVKVVLQHNDIFRAVNEINLSVH